MTLKRKFRLIEDIATADIAFDAYGENLGELFENSAIATTSIMVEMRGLRTKIKHTMRLENSEIEILLFDFLNELIFIKDAKNILFKKYNVNIIEREEKVLLKAELFGDKINPAKHSLKLDVKAVTIHLLKIEKTDNIYRARVVLDI